MEVLSEIINNALLITLNRPEAGNAFNGALSEGLSNALASAAENDDVRAIVVVLDPVCRSTSYDAYTLFSVRHLVANSTGVR